MESANRTGPVHYRTAAVGGVNVFYRAAGPDSGPAVLLLHGVPSSSRRFRDLIPGSPGATTSSPRGRPGLREDRTTPWTPSSRSSLLNRLRAADGGGCPPSSVLLS